MNIREKLVDAWRLKNISSQEAVDRKKIESMRSSLSGGEELTPMDAMKMHQIPSKYYSDVAKALLESKMPNIEENMPSD